MNSDPRDNTDAIAPNAVATPTEFVGSPATGAETPPQTGDPTPMAAGTPITAAGAPITPTTERGGIPFDQQATLRSRPPRFRPPSALMRPAWTRAVLFVAVPLLLWILTVATSHQPDDPSLEWVVSTTAPAAEPVVLRPAPGDSGKAGAMAVTRHGNRLQALQPGTRHSDDWQFPTVESAGLVGKTLDDAVVWIPREGPFALKTSSTADAPALLVLWTTGDSASRPVRLSLLSRTGKEVWTTVLDPDATPDRLSWVSTPQGPALAYTPSGAAPALYDTRTGTLLSSGR